MSLKKILGQDSKEVDVPSPGYLPLLHWVGVVDRDKAHGGQQNYKMEGAWVPKAPQRGHHPVTRNACIGMLEGVYR